jgi:glycosyltransferase involved in cell wall biosynthesis/peptidoglycan/xylan/chitin deacetylase (PgdA/CDA1 family)
MLLNAAYYLLKPYIPRRLRTALRRQHAARVRKANTEVWPIDPRAGIPPQSWPGWPQGKRFAFVLTHDVEGQRGLDSVEKLMRVDARNGFQSSFNFVPEGEYIVPAALRHTLERAGFEVGVHGLEHDGKLYSSKAQFSAKAARIREYMRDWNASGFRSPLMQHRLSWLHLLNAGYDASTFDTDPFEPQPDGAGTIFPFWVPGPNGSGYVELPYTLPQDSTLFIFLREQNIDIWKRKLDWIAERGGMALLNTHPDYMDFEGESPGSGRFPASYYEEFLRYVKEKYDGEFWGALPRDAAGYYRENIPVEHRNTRRKICMLTHSTYETDNRVRRYAETLAQQGDHVDVVAISGGSVPLGDEEISGVSVHRVQRRDRNERGKWSYAWRLLRFVVVSSRFLTRRHRRLRYDLIHVHNIPDFLVFAAWYPKLTGARLILDIHDIVPELFASKFETKAGDLFVALLKKIERASADFVDHVIVSNDLWRKKLIGRDIPGQKCTVFLNHVDLRIFFRRARKRNDGRFVILFPGSFHWHQGLDVAINAFALIKDRVPNAEFQLYGGGDTQGELVQLVDRLGLNARVLFCGSAPLEDIANIIANADLGVVPKRADSFGNEAYSTKIMEFMSQGVPAVVSKTEIDSFYFDDTVVRFFRSGDPAALAEAMLDVIENNTLRENLVREGYRYVDRYSWDQKRPEYLELINQLSTESFPEIDSTLRARVAKKPLNAA